MRILFVLVLFAIPSWQAVSLPRAAPRTGASPTPVVSWAATAVLGARASPQARAAPVRLVRLGGGGESGVPQSAGSVGVRRTIGAKATIKPLTAVQESELIATAQFFIEQHARRRLLEQVWTRLPTKVEWAVSSIAFNYLDADGNGRIEAHELARHVGDLDPRCPEIFTEHDSDGEGFLTFAAFVRLVAMEPAAEQPAAYKSARSSKGGAAVVGAPAVGQMLSKLGKALCADEERLLHFQQALVRGEVALKSLIRANQGMVHQIARQLRPRGGKSDLDDMLQDGNMGLMQAILRFDPSSGCRLSTYSYQWIKGLIMTGLHRRLNQVNLPQALAQDVFKLRKLLRESERLLVSTSHDELLHFAKQLNWDEDKLIRIVQASKVDTTNCFSLEAGFGGRDGSDGSSLSLGDLVTAKTTPRTDDFRMTLDAALKSRAERAQRIIRLRFGLEDGVEHTYTQIAQKVGISPQRVCNVVNEELRFLKGTRGMRMFRDGFEYSHV